MKKSLLAFSIALISMPALAANYSIDTRIDAMGGAGTAAADFLSAGFHNPALVAMDPDSSFGVLFPVIGLQYRDPDKLVDGLEDFGGVFDTFQADPTNSDNRTNAANALRNLQNKLAYVSGGIGGAIALPTSTISGNFFVKGYTEAVVMPEVSDNDISNIENPALDPNGDYSLTSQGRVLAFGVVDVGLALAGNLELAGQRFAVGVTPKSQNYYTYHYQVSVENFEGDDWDSDANRTEESAFNVDLGAAWQTGPFRVGFAAKNLISQEIKTVNRTREYTYHIEPVYTVGGAFVTDLFVAAIDVDLNEQKRFSAPSGPAIVDNTQLVRLGAEFNAFGWAQLRAGYINDLENTLDGTVTLGLGLSPFNTVHFDLAAQLIDSNSYGGSAQLAFTF
ncbi:conjugal transfer protein TraF [Grimontia kaedaensis]|uniref:Conjugal transfer protein TraF n=1 Tax=Grimontia kaedaensis TaxID=2872157 RepID=A0ABY4X2Q5_9GAMM|nr:conjugal transfer protein TraF [Grimontia kaedaensis]USH05553.1 conjugal transfer protein TraF [Grimontia kaedaensis]